MVNYKDLGLVNSREIFAKAMKGGYAIPAFNFNNMEQMQAIIQACVAQKSPVILQVSAGARKYANQTFRSCWGILSFRKRYGSEALEGCCENACRSGRMNYSYIRDTIGDFTEAGDADDGKMRYKADDSLFSLDSLLRRQGNGKAD